MMEQQGRVYWITGLSGSGKTTIGTGLYYRLKEERDNVVILDGDILKLFTTGGYSPEERLARASRYARLAKFLSDQGLWVVICTISMFDEVRAWNRANIDGYIEVFLDVPLAVLRERDRKGLYSQFAEGKVSQVVGLDGTAEFPKHPDIRIVNDGTLSVHECVEQILCVPMAGQTSSSSVAGYWDRVYVVSHDLTAASDFSQYVMQMLASVDEETLCSYGCRLLELGCGRGQDSLYFAKQGVAVTGVDISSEAIYQARAKTGNHDRVTFLCADFLKSPILFQSQYDVVYIRRSLEEVPVARYPSLFESFRTALKEDGWLCIEMRDDGKIPMETWRQRILSAGWSIVCGRRADGAFQWILQDAGNAQKET